MSPAHLGALIAAKPRVLGLIRDAVRRAFSLSRSRRRVIETATSTYLSALDSDEQAACSEGSPSGRRSVAANHRGTAGTGRHKPDHRTP